MMKREPFFLSFIRAIFYLGLLGLIGMLYWSSALVEKDLKFIKGELQLINSNLDMIQNGIKKFRLNHLDLESLSIKGHSDKGMLNLNLSDNSQNLLTLDPFYTQTLPKLLGEEFKPHGIRKEATIGKPDNLHPFSNWKDIASWNALCSVSLTTQQTGIYETYSPDMAVSMELRETDDGHPEYWFSLRRDVFWSPLNPNHFPPDVSLAAEFLRPHQVTAHDFKFYYDALMNPYVEASQAIALRLYFSDIEELRVIDDFTLAVRWKTKLVTDSQGIDDFKMKYMAKSFTGSLRPLAGFVYKYFSDGTPIVQDDSDPSTYRINPIWAQNFAHHWAQNIIVSCGPWLFDGMTDREIRFRRNPDYYLPEAVLVNSYEIKFRNSPDSIWEEFKSGSLDLFEIPPNLLSEYERFLQSRPYQKQKELSLGIKRLDYLGRSYNYIGWNQARPLFNSKKVRQALTLAIDRERIIRQYLNGMGMQITGTFFPSSPSYDHSLEPYPFDPDQARRLLQEEGWFDSDGDGVIDKLIDGKLVPFSFRLTYYVKSPTSKSICEYISGTLKKIGIRCNLNGVDIADLSAAFEDKDFDALLLGWALASPPENPKQVWYSTGAKQKGSSNAIGFANAEVDAIIDQLEYEYDPEKRIELYHRFDRIIYDEAPYTFLYAPKIALIYRDYLQNVFIPADRQDLIPGANVGEPIPNLFWINQK